MYMRLSQRTLYTMAKPLAVRNLLLTGFNWRREHLDINLTPTRWHIYGSIIKLHVNA